jgi:outer membrane protein OmpA-like peptidoglycan-associated protein
MKKLKFLIIFLCASIILSGCKSLTNTGKGAIIGTGGGAALGAGIGALIGKSGKSAGIGAAIGGVVGATAGTIIGKKMDKAAAEAAKVDGAQVQTVEDANGLKAVKVTFDSGILFDFNKSDLKANAKASLAKFAQVLVQNPTMDIAIYGHTDNVGTLAANQKVSLDRANAVADYLVSQGAARSQIKAVEGKDYSMPVASNETAEGRAQNRRVEVYMYASEKMIQEANQEAAK